MIKLLPIILALFLLALFFHLALWYMEKDFLDVAAKVVLTTLIEQEQPTPLATSTPKQP